MTIQITSGKTSKLNVTTTPKNRIQINTGGGGGGSGVDTLVELKDVLAASPVGNNYTVVYDVSTGKYKIQELPIIDGGTF